MNQPEEMPDQFEQKFAEAMRRVDAPGSFADRICARIQAAEPSRGKVLPMTPRMRLWVSGALAAGLLLGVVATEEVHRRQQREQAAMAQQQFQEALRITDRALDHAREQLQQAGVQLVDSGN